VPLPPWRTEEAQVIAATKVRDPGHASVARPARAVAPNWSAASLSISVHSELDELAQTWREFEKDSDCSVFQTFDWLSAWQRTIGVNSAVTPAVIIARDLVERTIFIAPLSIVPSPLGRVLTWLGSDLCDYNAPLIARDFYSHFAHQSFGELWTDIIKALQNHPATRHDFVKLEKMPELVGPQLNPMLQLPVVAHPSGAHSTRLTASWDTYYFEKRSSATRRRDRTKLKRLAEFGDVEFKTAATAQEALEAFQNLVKQKEYWFAHKGIPNLFAHPGYVDFYRALLANDSSRQLVHVSHLQVGATVAAVNLGLVFGGRYHHVLASHCHGAIAQFGPGVAHLREIIKYAIERGLEVFDFTIGDEGYKRDWCETESRLFDHLSGTTLRGRMAVTLLSAAKSGKRVVKQTPVLWSGFTALRRLLFSRVDPAKGGNG
jgi:CelD/BcsL family acetyltransferase involved in cellulose biosynthesis